VDGRARWRAVQTHLANARASLKTGELDRALEQVEAALDIDPEYLAAGAIRERTAPSEAFTRFEQRARQRRVERQLASTRAAMSCGNLVAARATMSEVRRLDPENAGLMELGTALDSVERTELTRRRAVWIVVAAAALVGVVLGARWLGHGAATLTVSRLPVAIPRLTDSILVVGTVRTPKAESGQSARQDAPPARPAASRPIHIPSARVVESPVAAVVTFLPALPVFLPLAMTELPGASTPDRLLPAAAGERLRPRSDEDLVKETLQRYGIALEEAPRSGRLAVDDCTVQVSGVIATASCRSSARYAPKADTRDTRIESPAWHFTLRKAAAGWQVDAARVVP
jgi:hypothetical protein